MRAPARTGTWIDYVAGPLAMLADGGSRCPRWTWRWRATSRPGAGLSSSAALEVAVAVAGASLGGGAPWGAGDSGAERGAGDDADLRALARVAHRAEREFVGVPCGMMDQFAVSLARAGHALHLKCDTGHTEHVPFAQSVLVFDTGVSRGLRDSAYAARRDECHRAMHLLRDTFPGLRWLANATMEQAHEAGLPSPLLQPRTARDRGERPGGAGGGGAAGDAVTCRERCCYESHRSLRDAVRVLRAGARLVRGGGSRPAGGNGRPSDRGGVGWLRDRSGNGRRAARGGGRRWRRTIARGSRVSRGGGSRERRKGRRLTGEETNAECRGLYAGSGCWH